MRAFLIDFENVKSAGLTGIEDLTSDDRVIILYSVNSNTISFEMHQKIINCQAAVEYFQIRRGGKNSLDFQLSTLLGWMLASGSYSHLYIISNDSGFDALYDFWNSGYVTTDCVVYRRSNLALADGHSKNYRKPAPAAPLEPEAAEETISVDELPMEALVEAAHLPEAVQEAAQALLPEAEELDVVNVIDLFSASHKPLGEGEDALELPVLSVRNEDEEEDAGLSLEAILAASPITPTEEEKIAAEKDTEIRIRRVAAALPAALSEIVSDEHRTRIAGDVVSSLGKQDFYRDIIRRYGQKKGLLVYKTVKSEYTSLKKLADA